MMVLRLVGVLGVLAAAGCTSNAATAGLVRDPMQLRAQFNADVSKVRVLMVLSPGCASCAEGARLVETDVFAKIKDQDLTGYVVWGPFLGQDSETMAERAMVLVPDGRVRHYWDERKRVAVGLTSVLQISPSLGWDVFLVYPKGTKWERADLTPPAPKVFMTRSRSMTKGQYLDGAAMRAQVQQLLQQTP